MRRWATWLLVGGLAALAAIAVADAVRGKPQVHATQPTTISVAYFQSVLDLDQVSGTALVTELLGTSLNTWTNTVSFSVRHFSGYLIGTGLTDSGDGSQ